MNPLDIVILIFLIIGISSGYRKGFLTMLFSLLALFLGILAGFKLMGAAMLTLNDYYKFDEKILPYAAFAVVFIVVVIVVNLLGNLMKSVLDKTVLGNIDQMAGAVLGLFKTAFMISILFWILESLAIETFFRFTDNSWLYGYVAAVAPAVTAWAGDLIPAFGELLQPHE